MTAKGTGGHEGLPRRRGILSRHSRAGHLPFELMLPSVGCGKPQGAAGAGWMAWECAGSSPLPLAKLLPLAFEGAAGNVGNGVLVILSFAFVGPEVSAQGLTSS